MDNNRCINCKHLRSENIVHAGNLIKPIHVCRSVSRTETQNNAGKIIDPKWFGCIYFEGKK